MDLSKINSFLNRMNDKASEYALFEEEKINEKNRNIQQAKDDAEKLINSMEAQLSSYITNNFESIKKDTENSIALLKTVFEDLYNNTTPNVTTKDLLNYEQTKELLSQKVTSLNEKLERLNEMEFDSRVPAKEIKHTGDESFDVTFNGEVKHYTTQSIPTKIDESSVIDLFDKDFVKEIFSNAKDVIVISEALGILYKKNFNSNDFKDDVISKEKNYIDEIEANTTNDIKEREYNDFESSEVNQYYSSFFEDLDNVTADAIPNVETGSDKYKENVALGNLCYRALNDDKYISYFDKTESLKERIKRGYISVPFIADLRSRGNLFVNVDCDRYSDELRDFINQIILSFLLSFPAKRIHFKLVDINDKMGFAPFSALRKINDNILLDGIVRDVNQLDDALNEIKNIKFNSEDKLGAEGMTNVFDYNKKYESSPMDVYVFVLIDFPSGFNVASGSKVRDIMLNGKNDGVFTVFVNNEAIKTDDYNFPFDDYKKIIHDIVSCSYCFDATNGIKYIDEQDREYPIELFENINMRNLGQIVETLKVRAEEASSKSIELTDMFNYIDRVPVKDISKEIEIPFGMAGGDVQTLSLTNLSSPHAGLIGTSGSGKSVLLHTLILDACYKYSPEELNVYLYDFKRTEFDYYRRYKLPHIKIIACCKDTYDQNAILKNINSEIDRRAKIFKAVGVSDIEQYYEIGKRIPRLFVVIDEIQEAFTDNKVGEDSLNALSEVLRIARSFGINIIWGSQSVPNAPGFDSKIMNNVTSRICLKVDSSDRAMKLFSSNDSSVMSATLKAVENLNRPGLVGLGVIRDARTGANVKEFRVAYSEDGEKRSKYVDMINSKWANVQTYNDLYVLGDDAIPNAHFDVEYAKEKENIVIDNKAFESYWLSLGTDYISGKPYKFEVSNSKDRENVIVVGNNTDLIRDIMGYSLLSVLLNKLTDKDCIGSPNSKIYYVNKEGLNPTLTNDLYNVIPNKLGSEVDVVGRQDKFINTIRELYLTYKDRKDQMDDQQIPYNYHPIYMFINSAQYLNDFFENDSPLDTDDGIVTFDGAPATSEMTLTNAFKVLLKKGSQYGIHFIMSINSIDSIREIREELKQFNYKIATVGSDPSSFINRSPSQIPNADNDRVAVIENGDNLFKIRPYRFDEKDGKEQEWLSNLIYKYSNN